MVLQPTMPPACAPACIIRSAWDRAEIRGSTPGKATCFVESSSISDFSQSFSLRASTPKFVDAAQSLRPCRDHV